MSSHLLRFLMVFWGAFSVHAKLPYSLVEPRWLTEVFIACQRLRPVDDPELDSLEPAARVSWMVDTYGGLLEQLVPKAVARVGAPERVDPSFARQARSTTLERMPAIGNGDLSIKAVNEAIALSPAPRSATAHPTHDSVRAKLRGLNHS